MTTATGDGLAGRLLAGRYRLEHVIATGGMAQVWEATDEVLARPVAVKLLHAHLAADGVFVERFRREAIAAARLTHPSIVAIYDTCTQDGVEAIVMELVRGSTLRDLLDERHALDSPEAVAVVSQVADALGVAHRAGIVHRDIKPANILLSNDGRVLVADFGIAKAAEGVSDLTGTGTTLGTVKYLSPEQVEGKPVDARTDVYALGVVLYECVCGRPPFLADTDTATALARLHQDPMRPRQVKASVPKALEEIMLRALARDPAGRYATAHDLRAALLAASRGEALGASPVTGHDATVTTRGPDATATSVSAQRAPAPPRHRTPAGGAQPARPAPKQAPTKRGPIVVAVLTVIALVVAALLLFGRPGSGGTTIGGPTTPGSVNPPGSTLRATAFDPFGGDGENDADAAKAVDGDAKTSWSTEGYAVRKFATKPGVGLIVTLQGEQALRSITVDSAETNDWSVELYVGSGSLPTLADWGQPVTAKDRVARGRSTFDLKGTKGSEVLIWITDVGDESGDRAHARIAEVSIALN
ncbi:MAG: protein kinase domain-containing protein [Acidimicrobiales bacterium]